MVPDEEIARIVQAATDPEQACRCLMAQANEQGGKDNIPVIVARFSAVPAGSKDASLTLDPLNSIKGRSDILAGGRGATR